MLELMLEQVLINTSAQGKQKGIIIVTVPAPTINRANGGTRAMTAGSLRGGREEGVTYASVNCAFCTSVMLIPVGIQ